MNRVEWTRSAISDLAGIYAYIAKDSERYATHVVDRITDRTRQIAEFPFSGEMVPEYQRKDIREIIEFSYPRSVFGGRFDHLYSSINSWLSASS